VEQPIQRLFYAVAAQLNYHVFGGDAKDAYAHSPPPRVPTYVHIDDAYADWYYARCGIPVDRKLVLPVQHALQGHPESGKLWEDHINSILFSSELSFQTTTHDRTIYRADIDGEPVLLLRQVDDFSLACRLEATARAVFDVLLDDNSNCLANQLPLLFISVWSQTLTALMCTNDNPISSFPWKHTSPVC
jgi:hypothetical protein